MSFNEDELMKITKASSGLFKKSVRVAISNSLLETKAKIIEAKKLGGVQYQKALQELMEEAAADRKRAFQLGATSYGDAKWAAAAASETWLHELVNGTPKGIERVEALIQGLINR